MKSTSKTAPRNTITTDTAKPKRWEPASATPGMLWNLRRVMAETTWGRSAIYKAVGEGKFPRPIRFGGRVAWLPAEVQQWLQDRIAERV